MSEQIRQVEMPVDNFEKLKMTAKWYDDMPAYLEVGDRFHERVAEVMDGLLPEMEEIASDEYFNGGVEEKEGKLLLTLTSSDDPENEIQIELVPV